MMPINQIAGVSVPEASMLVIAPFDKKAIKAIETAILKSELGLNPANDGNVIRLPIPPLNEERRRDLTRVVSRMGEEIKTAVRNVAGTPTRTSRGWKRTSRPPERGRRQEGPRAGPEGHRRDHQGDRGDRQAQGSRDHARLIRSGGARWTPGP